MDAKDAVAAGRLKQPDLHTIKKEVRETDGGGSDGDKVVKGGPAGITPEHVRAFTPLVRRGEPNGELPPEHEALIIMFKSLKDHGITVEGTDTPETLKTLLEQLAPSTVERTLIAAMVSGFTGGMNKFVTVRVGNDAESGKPVTVWLPLEQVQLLAHHLHGPADLDSRLQVQEVKTLVDKGAELFLEFSRPLAFDAKNGAETPPPRVKVSPEIFHWFMTHPTYDRKISPLEQSIASVLYPFGGFAAIGATGMYYLNQFSSPAVQQWTTPAVRERVIQGGYMDTVQDGKPGEPAIRAKNWEEFAETLEALKTQVAAHERKARETELGFQMFTGKTA